MGILHVGQTGALDVAHGNILAWVVSELLLCLLEFPLKDIHRADVEVEGMLALSDDSGSGARTRSTCSPPRFIVSLSFPLCRCVGMDESEYEYGGEDDMYECVRTYWCMHARIIM